MTTGLLFRCFHQTSPFTFTPDQQNKSLPYSRAFTHMDLGLTPIFISTAMASSTLLLAAAFAVGSLAQSLSQSPAATTLDLFIDAEPDQVSKPATRDPRAVLQHPRLARPPHATALHLAINTPPGLRGIRHRRRRLRNNHGHLLHKRRLRLRPADRHLRRQNRGKPQPLHNPSTTSPSDISKDTITFRGSTVFGFSSATEFNTLGYDASGLATESCSLEPTTRAVCSVTVKFSAEDDGKTGTQDTITYDGAQATDRWFQVPITGGAEKLPAASATCTAGGNAAAGMGVPEVWKVVVVPGAAALLAGAAVL